MDQRGAPHNMGSIDPGWPYQGAEIKAMPTIKAINANLGSREVDIRVLIFARSKEASLLPGAKHIRPTTRKFTKTETLTGGTYPSRGFPVMVRMIKEMRPAKIPAQIGRSETCRYRPNPKAGSSCINMPFWKMMMTPIWSSLRNMPSKNAKPQTSTEFTSPIRTTFFLDIDGTSVFLKMSRETMLEAPINALSAVDMMAAKHEHVIRVTKKY
mmetsp:Transcript_47459/g.58336  ORF Transcript_47459/g.58336 Transcript_47459/m.58336 type:complete len:212 (+) Transcript_47459:431-1066(+)